MPQKIRERLDAAEEILNALRSGEVDAIVASGPDGDRVYTLKGADEAYRLMVQNMAEGALTVEPNGLILFCNERFASMLAIPQERIIGSSFHDFIVPQDAGIFSALLNTKLGASAKREVWLKPPGGSPIPVSVTANRLVLDGCVCFCIIVSDLAEQKRYEEVLHALSARLLQIQDEDRRRIAQGLHNGAFQRLAALEFKLTAIRHISPNLPPAARQNLTDCLDLVGECCNDLGNLAYLIQPPLLEEQGLGPALRAYVTAYNRRYGLQISLSIPRRQGRLPAEVETTLFRIAQEALTNIRDHSGSATGKIRFFWKPSELILEVADRGCGISKKILKQLNGGTALPGVGIAGMRERVRQLGGFMKIFSGSGGTRLKVILPTTGIAGSSPAQL